MALVQCFICILRWFLVRAFLLSGALRPGFRTGRIRRMQTRVLVEVEQARLAGDGNQISLFAQLIESCIIGVSGEVDLVTENRGRREEHEVGRIQAEIHIELECAVMQRPPLPACRMRDRFSCRMVPGRLCE